MEDIFKIFTFLLFNHNTYLGKMHFKTQFTGINFYGEKTQKVMLLFFSNIFAIRVNHDNGICFFFLMKRAEMCPVRHSLYFQYIHKALATTELQNIF